MSWLGALAIGLSLGLLGSGGSVLTVPVLIYLVGQDEKVAIAGSLAVVGSIALIGSLPFLRRRMIDWRSLAWFGIPGIAGTWSGAWAAAFVSGATQLIAFAAVMLVAAGFMLKPLRVNAPSPVHPGAAPVGGHVQSVTRAEWKIVIDGLLVGIVTGFVGVGGGFLIVPALVLLGGLSMHRAIGTSLAIIALKSFAGFWKYLDVLQQTGLSLDTPVLVKFALVGIAGSLLGNQLGNRIDQRRLKQGFGVFLIGMALFIIWRHLPAGTTS